MSLNGVADPQAVRRLAAVRAAASARPVAPPDAVTQELPVVAATGRRAPGPLSLAELLGPDEVTGPAAGREFTPVTVPPLPPVPGGLRARLRMACDGLLPTPLRDARWHVGRAGVVALAVLGLLAVAVGGWWVLRGRAQPTDLAARTVVATVPAAAAPPAVSGVPALPLAEATTGLLVVDVEGRVRRPGLRRLPAGARVADAIAAAGGALPGTDTTGLDLASRLTDGTQLRIGAAAAVAPQAGPGAGAADGSTAAVPPVDLSTATEAQLEALPGVGPVTAGRIVAWRTAHGGFSSVAQLQEVPGIGPATFARLAPLVTV